MRDPLVAALEQALREFYSDAPQQSASCGRIINQRHFDRLCGYLTSGQIAYVGQHDARDLYLAPTILTGVPADAAVMREEIFGPILPMLDFDTLEDALATLRDRPTPLALYLFSRDRAAQERVLAATRSGGVCLNDTVTHMIGKNLPVGGPGKSGLGTYHGRASFDCLSDRPSVLRRSFTFDRRLRYPPPRVALTTRKRAFRFIVNG